MIKEDFPGGTHEHHCHYGTAWRLYKDEPIKELESALVAQGFQISGHKTALIC